MLCSGCVGLGIPSVRYHDGSPREGRTLDEAILFDTEGPSCADGQCGPLPGEQFAAEDCGEAASVEPPELPNVPWPRFHPLPTAPVFSSR